MPPDEARTVAYDAARRWDGSDFYGAGVLALHRLARTKGYSLVYCESHGVNCFFLRDDVLGVRLYNDNMTNAVTADGVDSIRDSPSHLSLGLRVEELWKAPRFYGRKSMAHPRAPAGKWVNV